MQGTKKLNLILVCLYILGALLLSVTSAGAQDRRVVTFGANLSDQQKQQVARLVGLEYPLPEQVTQVTVTNQEERKYLSGLVPDNVIGNKAISSALIEVSSPGSGIVVLTKNISWVTEQMFASALATAGVKDARVTAVAPFAVSGTAALTGIVKGFEQATGQTINEESKRTATQELVETGKLGEAINDKEKATQLITLIKERIIKEKTSDPQQIKQIIINVAGDLNINLTNQQIDDITNLMQNINRLDLNVQDIRGQLENISKNWDQLVAQNEQVKGILQQILDALTNFVNRLLAIFGP